MYKRGVLTLPILILLLAALSFSSQATNGYSCSKCHPSNLPKGYRHAVVLRDGHSTLSCRDCHNPLKPWILRNNVTISSQASWSICMNCHFKEYMDYIHNIHGGLKEYCRGLGSLILIVNGTRILIPLCTSPIKVKRSCFSCHDPHNPRFTLKLSLGKPPGRPTPPSQSTIMDSLCAVSLCSVSLIVLALSLRLRGVC